MVSCTRNAESWRIWCLWHILRQKLEQCCRIFPAISGVRAVHLSLIEFMLLMQSYMLQLNCWATYLLQVNSRHQKEHCRFSKRINFCAFMLISFEYRMKLRYWKLKMIVWRQRLEILENLPGHHQSLQVAHRLLHHGSR